MSHDDCNADGYVNSIYTLGIGAANEHGVSTYYGERCSAMFAVTYCSGKHSSGSGKDPKADIITTYLHHQCTNHFVGTSSAAPLAAGIFALVLQANNNITWRDLQHLVFNTTLKTSPSDSGWMKNGVGKEYNHKFGFGLINAEKLVEAALKWNNVAPQRSCHFRLQFHNGNIPSRQHFKLSFKTDACQSCKKKEDDGKCKHAVTKLEHVVVNVTLKHRRRGDLSIQLISPSGTVSNLLHQRPYDGSSTGLKGWSFMTLYNWGEDPKGTWKLIFTDNKEMNSFKKVTRDLEEEYIEKLDHEKDIAEKKTAKKDAPSSDENVVEAKEDLYKRESTAFKSNVDVPRQYDDSYNEESSYSQRFNKHDNPAYDRLQREYDDYQQRRRDDYDRRQLQYYDNKRKRRTVMVEDKTDYVTYKKDDIESYQYKYDDEELSKSDLAGVVTDISITFYGTS